jgi:hypothetical protein
MSATINRAMMAIAIAYRCHSSRIAPAASRPSMPKNNKITPCRGARRPRQGWAGGDEVEAVAPAWQRLSPARRALQRNPRIQVTCAAPNAATEVNRASLQRRKPRRNNMR